MICKICAEVYEDTNNSDLGLCPKHQKLHEDGYIAIIAVNPNTTEAKDQMVDSRHIQRTGRIATMTRNSAQLMFPHCLKENLQASHIFISDELMDQVEELLSYAENSLTN